MVVTDPDYHGVPCRGHRLRSLPAFLPAAICPEQAYHVPGVRALPFPTAAGRPPPVPLCLPPCSIQTRRACGGSEQRGNCGRPPRGREEGKAARGTPRRPKGTENGCGSAFGGVVSPSVLVFGRGDR